MNVGFPLDSDETIIRRVNRHWIALAPVIAAVGAVVLIVIGLSYMFARFRDALPPTVTPTGLAGVLALLLVFALLILAGGLWVYHRNFLLLTTKHLIRVEQRGLFTRNVSLLSLSRVQDVSGSVPGFLATILGFGNVIVQTAGEEDNFIFTMVPSPSRLADDCLAAHDRFVAAAPSTDTAAV